MRIFSHERVIIINNPCFKFDEYLGLGHILRSKPTPETITICPHVQVKISKYYTSIKPGKRTLSPYWPHLRLSTSETYDWETLLKGGTFY